MAAKSFLALVRAALAAISEPRLFATERGYQGELATQLTSRLPLARIWPGQPLVEQEYQKRAKLHGLRERPDIVIHVPFERGGLTNRKQGNFAVIELKRCASRRQAYRDFQKLAKVVRVLSYRYGIFINV